MRCASGQPGMLVAEPVKARAASSCVSGPRACRRRRSALRSRALLSLASDIILKWDSRHTADSTALEPDGSRWRLLHCNRLSDQGRTCTPTATRNLRLHNIGSRTVCLAHTPGIHLNYSPDNSETVIKSLKSADFQLTQLVQGVVQLAVKAVD